MTKGQLKEQVKQQMNRASEYEIKAINFEIELQHEKNFREIDNKKNKRDFIELGLELDELRKSNHNLTLMIANKQGEMKKDWRTKKIKELEKALEERQDRVALIEDERIEARLELKKLKDNFQAKVMNEVEEKTKDITSANKTLQRELNEEGRVSVHLYNAEVEKNGFLTQRLMTLEEHNSKIMEAFSINTKVSADARMIEAQNSHAPGPSNNWHGRGNGY